MLRRPERARFSRRARRRRGCSGSRSSRPRADVRIRVEVARLDVGNFGCALEKAARRARREEDVRVAGDADEEERRTIGGDGRMFFATRGVDRADRDRRAERVASLAALRDDDVRLTGIGERAGEVVVVERELVLGETRDGAALEDSGDGALRSERLRGIALAFRSGIDVVRGIGARRIAVDRRSGIGAAAVVARSRRRLRIVTDAGHPTESSGNHDQRRDRAPGNHPRQYTCGTRLPGSSVDGEHRFFARFAALC